jgi:hypothetical protein
MDILQNNKLNKILFFTFFFVFSAFTYTIYDDYGITGDAIVQEQYGNYVWDFVKHGGKPIIPFDSIYKDNMVNMKYYGGLFDGSSSMIIDLFEIKDIYGFRHGLNLFFGLLGILFCGLLVREIAGTWFSGILGLICIILLPRYFGEMFNNPKDIPFAAGYIMTLYYMIRIVKNLDKPDWIIMLGFAISFGLSMGVRVGGLILLFYFGLISLFYFIKDYKMDFSKVKKTFFFSLVSIFLGYLIACIFWPYTRDNFISAPLEALSQFSGFEVMIYLLFEGKRYFTKDLPSYYLTHWLYIGNPIYILIGFVSSIVLVFLDKKNRIIYLFLIFMVCFPVFYIHYKKSIVYDAMRHILFVLPVMAVLSALSINYFITKLNTTSAKIGGFLIVLLLFALPLKHMAKNHPNQYVYFNEIFGGVKKAFGYYETDYYHNSGKLASDWVKKNILNNAASKVKILSNMGTQHLYYQKMDTAKVYATYGRWRERDHLDWDYYVAYSRFIEPENLQNGAWPPGKIVYRISVEEVPICVVMQRLNKDDILAYEALNKGDMINAAALYQKNLSIDNSNEYAWYYYSIALANTNRIEEAINALKTAIQLNSSNPEWVEQLQKYYQMYASQKG